MHRDLGKIFLSIGARSSRNYIVSYPKPIIAEIPYIYFIALLWLTTQLHLKWNFKTQVSLQLFLQGGGSSNGFG